MVLWQRCRGSRGSERASPGFSQSQVPGGVRVWCCGSAAAPERGRGRGRIPRTAPAFCCETSCPWKTPGALGDSAALSNSPHRCRGGELGCTMGSRGCARSDGNAPGSCPLLWEGSWAEPVPLLVSGASRALAMSGPGGEERVRHCPGRGSSGRRRVEAICSCRGRRTFPLPAGRVEGPADAPVPGGGSSLAQDALPEPGPSLPASPRGLRLPVPVLPRAQRVRRGRAAAHSGHSAPPPGPPVCKQPRHGPQ